MQLTRWRAGHRWTKWPIRSSVLLQSWSPNRVQLSLSLVRLAQGLTGKCVIRWWQQCMVCLQPLVCTDRPVLWHTLLIGRALAVLTSWLKL